MSEKVIDLEGNERLQRFIQLLCDLNQQTVEMLKTGNTEYLYAMNDTIEEMYAILVMRIGYMRMPEQHNG